MSDKEKKDDSEKSGREENDASFFGQETDKFKRRFSSGENGGGNNFYWIYGVIVLFLLFFTFFGGSFSGKIREVPMAVFEQEMLAKGDVIDIVIVNKEYARITINPDSIALCDRYKDRKTGKSIFEKGYRGPHFIVSVPSVENFLERIEKVQKEAGIPSNRQVYARSVQESDWTDTLSWIIPIVLLIIFWSLFMRRMSGGAGGPGQIFSIGKSRATLYDKNTHVNVTFDDVAGLEGAKMELKEIVDFLKNPKKYTALGAKIPKGALLVGPPGTGKTLLAKAVAGEAKVPFFSLSGSDFVEMFVGVGASRVRDLFKNAKEKAPCIIFIDEIDAVGRARGKSISAGANDERESTLNQLLTEMDGFNSNLGIIVLAATNRPDILDKALLRAGRFDRQIYVDMPDLAERKEIFKVHLKKIKYDDTVDVDFLARQTPGFSGADIANICNEAALIAARKNKKSVSRQDFLDAVDRVIAGLEKKNKIITRHEKEVIAFHEAGHATVSWMLEHASPLVKVTIVPRGRSLGAAWYLPEERQITTVDQIMDEMSAALGGRAAEEIIFGKVSTGALNDLEKVTKQAYASIMYYGLNDKIGNISFYDSSGQYEFGFSKPYSEYTAQLIDQEAKKMVDIAYQRAKAILTEHKEKLKVLAYKLLEKEVIFKEDLEEIFGKRPFEKPEEQETQNKEPEQKKEKQEDTTSAG